MEQKHSTIGLKIFVVTIAALVIALASFGVGLGVGLVTGKNTQTSLAAAPQSEAPDAGAPAALPSPAAERTPTATEKTDATGSAPKLDTKLFNEALDLLNQQFYGDLPQGEDLTHKVLQGFVGQLGDPHTAFLDPQQAEMFNTDLQGSFEGIGARVDKATGGGVELKYLYADQPAINAGLQVGDFIMKVDGQDVTGLSLDDAIMLIRGPRDTKVVLTIKRGDQEPFDVTVTRKRIEIPVVETKTLGDGKIAYVALSEFSSVAPDKLKSALTDALAKQPAGLILDLRGNPGGFLDSAVQIGSYFVPEGDILIERFKDGREQHYPRQGRFLLGTTPLVVLIDGGSASASEIVAGAIQDAGTGKLIGETSYGKGSVQLPNALSDGSQLRVTIAHWFTPKDRAIHGVGLTPDIEVKLTADDVKAQRDPQLDRAVEFLLTGK